MQRKIVNSQLYNYKTYLAYKDKMLSLAMNVFQFKNMNNFIDMSRVNKELVINGSVAFFEDEVMGLIALPYTIMGALDIYGRPNSIKPIPYFGSYNRILHKGEFVIMYDNEAKIPILPNIIQSCERLALIKRTIDTNITQQRTPRFWKTSEERKNTIKRMLDEVDSCSDSIVTYDDIDLDETSLVLSPAPYVADKLIEAKKEEWTEFLELIGIANTSVQKKERVIRDEIFTSMGGTIASRYGRFESRRKAVEDINRLFGENIEVEFYDGLPSTIQNVDDFLVEEDENNEINISDTNNDNETMLPSSDNE